MYLTIFSSSKKIYKDPICEEKIFLFLDLKSSTTIAEKLGNKKYSSFLQKFFLDLTEPVIVTKGEIFQYCGDEIVIVWSKENGIENNNALHFFFLVEKKILQNKKKYINEFGIYPFYKAGIHFGKIITTEVGSIKKETAYHGDTINTTSRILSKCNPLNKRLLVSAEFLSLLNYKNNFKATFAGKYSLRGKNNSTSLFSIEEKNKKLKPLDSFCNKKNKNSFCYK